MGLRVKKSAKSFLIILQQEHFLFSGLSAGLKKSKKKDLGLVFFKYPCVVAGVYTKNCYPAPHILYAKKHLPSKNIRGIIVNSGQSLAGTGKAGILANEKIITGAAKILGVKGSSILSSSTGVIGAIPDIEKIHKALPSLKEKLGLNFSSFAESILTTDKKTKISKLYFGQNSEYFVLGICKGSGMIAPNMATMLSYVFTNYPFSLAELPKITSFIAEQSFNCVSVDSDTSTSDSFFLVSSTSSKKIGTSKKLAIQNIGKVAQDLAKQIAADGEGVQHLIELKVKRAPNKKLAKTILQTIINSPLVKCCINGEDANWGRILMALGNALAKHNRQEFLPVTIKIQGIEIFSIDAPTSFNEKILKEKMQNFQVNLEVDLMEGKHNIKGWGCDLSKEYISINADYRT